jgi:plastocyanin domain-containing protein
MRAAALLLPLAALALVSCSKASATTTPVAATWVSADGTKNYQVSVGEHGFTPSTVAIAKGEKAALEFTRTTDHTCATAVVFPELNLKKDLPLNVAVAVAVPTDTARTVGFECGMGMYKSSIVIK